MGAPCRIACVLAVLLLLTGVLTSAAAMSLPFSTKKVQASSRAVVYKHLTLEQALHDAHQHAGTAVLIVGTAPPRRRAPQQPLLLFSTRAASQVPYAVQQLLVQGLTQLQHLSGGSVGRYCLVLDALSADSQEAAGARVHCCCATLVPSAVSSPSNTPPFRLDMHTGDGWPLVVFDASTGSVLLGPTVLQALQSTPVHVVSAAVQAMMAAAQQLMHLGGQVGCVGSQAGGQLADWGCLPVRHQLRQPHTRRWIPACHAPAGSAPRLPPPPAAGPPSSTCTGGSSCHGCCAQVVLLCMSDRAGAAVTPHHQCGCE